MGVDYSAKIIYGTKAEEVDIPEEGDFEPCEWVHQRSSYSKINPEIVGMVVASSDIDYSINSLSNPIISEDERVYIKEQMKTLFNYIGDLRLYLMPHIW